METPDGHLRPASGLSFGSRFLGGNSVRVLEILPETSYKRIRNQKSFWLAWMVDIFARHVDNRQAIFLEDANGWLKAFFIDNGHLFGGPKGEQQKKFLASRYLDPRIYHGLSYPYLLELQMAPESLDVDQLWERMRALPDHWKTPSAVDGFAQCLERLSTPKLLQNVVDTMSEACKRSSGFEYNGFQLGQKASCTFLHTGVQVTGLRRNVVANCADHPARA
jgi:hypothetical protein